MGGEYATVRRYAVAGVIGLVCVGGSPVLPQGLHGQVLSELERGDSVRVRTLDGQKVEGVVAAIRQLEVDILNEESDRSTTLRVTTFERLEVYRGERSAAGEGMIAGLLGGAVVGGLLGLLDGSCNDLACSRSDHVFVGAGVLAVVGLPVGLLVGTVTRVDNWEHISLKPDFSIVPGSATRAQLGFSIRLGGR